MTYDWALLYYLYTVALSVKEASFFIMLFSGLGIAFAGVVLFVATVENTSTKDDEFPLEPVWKALKVLSFVCVVAWVISTIIPGRQDTKVMVALVGIENAVKSDKARNLAGKSYRVIDEWLDRLEKGK